jgi:hypothetical protein
MNLTNRQTKAIELVATGALTSLVEVQTGHFLIPSASAEGAFYVTSDWDCTCPDHANRGVDCKHMVALRLQRVLDAAQEDKPYAPPAVEDQVDAWLAAHPVACTSRCVPGEHHHPRVERED